MCVLIGRMFIDGVEIAPTDLVPGHNEQLLATGGDGFTVFNEGTSAWEEPDIDALVAALGAAEPAGIAVLPLTHRPDPSACSRPGWPANCPAS